MKITEDALYHVAIRYPWGELSITEQVRVTRDGSGSLLLDGGVVATGLEPSVDCIIQETEGWIMGWLGGTCDTPVVVSCVENAPLP